jgi:hypothetical protein
MRQGLPERGESAKRWRKMPNRERLFEIAPGTDNGRAVVIPGTDRTGACDEGADAFG